MTVLHIEASALGGESVETTAREMQRLADQLNVCVELKFNDVRLHALPGGSADWLVKNWARETHAKSMFPSAWSHQEPLPQHQRGKDG